MPCCSRVIGPVGGGAETATGDEDVTSEDDVAAREAGGVTVAHPGSGDSGRLASDGAGDGEDAWLSAGDDAAWGYMGVTGSGACVPAGRAVASRVSQLQANE